VITLARPYASPTHSVTLPNPTLGDTEQLDIKVNLKHSMDGTMYSTVKTPATRKFLLDFQLLTLTQKTALVAFLTSYAGEDIKFTDWRTPANNHKVKILNTPLSFKESKNGWSFTLEMTTTGV